MIEEKPVNYHPFLKAIILTLTAHGDVPDSAIEEIVEALNAAVEADTEFMLQHDYQEFMSVLDGVLDSIDNNGYAEQVTELDRLRQELESEDESKAPLEAIANTLSQTSEA
ncbi:hypothetical protein [Haloarcula marismortui]|uniref:Uncharacterized protein n=1 Tax=Haloarcula marismortui ATCC 33799 TaxID=662475 RepID=M0JK63_9EURY|nr:hypothetical protein [Haloarcula californiae]EMA09497.1 hypothetical protein C435_22054 [Haloarcula californiae ATCC 33799]